MALQVGSAYSTYSLKTDGVQEAAQVAITALRSLRSVSGSLALQIEKDNQRIVTSYQTTQQALQNINPFAPIMAQAAGLGQAATGPMSQLRKQASADIEGLRQNLQAINAFAPLGVQAAQAAAQTRQRTQEIEAAIEKLEVELGHIGIPRSALSQFFNDMGDLRNAVLTATGATEAERNRNAGLFGKQRSRNEVERRMDELARQEGSAGNLLGQSGGDLNQIEQLIARAKEGHDELAALQTELRGLTSAAQGATLDPVANSILEAIDAEKQFIATNAEAIRSAEQLADAAGQVSRLTAEVDALAAASLDAARSEQERLAAEAQATQAERDLTAAEARRVALEDQSAAAAAEHAASIQRVADAQRELNQLLGAAPVANAQGGSGIANATPGLLAKLQADAEKQQARFAAEQKARDDQALQNRLDNENRLAVAQQAHVTATQVAETNAAAAVNQTKLAGEQALLIKQTEDATTVAKAQLDANAKVEQQRLKSEATVEAKRIDSVQKAAAADQAAQAKVEAARIAADAKIQAGRDKINAQQARQAGTPAQDPQIATLRSFAQAEIQARRYGSALDALDKAIKLVQNDEVLLNRIQGTINRVQVLQQSGGGGLLNLGDLTGTGRELLAVAGYGSAAIIVFQALQKTLQLLKDSFSLVAETDLNRRSVDQLIGSISLGNRVFQQAIAFGQKYGFTQKEMADAAQEAGVILRTSNTEASKAFEVLARLQTRAPGKTFSDAVRAVAELQAGQLQSIERIFNVPSEMAQRMKLAIDQGIDPIKAVDQALTELGATADILAERTKGPAGAITNLTLANEEFKKSIGDLITGPGRGLLNFLSSLLRTGAGTLEGMIALGRGGADALTRLLSAAQNSRGLESILALSFQVASGFKLTNEQAHDLVETLAKLRPPDAIQEASDDLTRLNNQLDAGQIGLAKYKQGLDRIAASAGIKPADDQGIVKTANAISDLDLRAQALTTRFNTLRREADQDPQLLQKYLPQMLAIENELVEIQRHSPIVITVEMQLEMAGDLTNALSGTTDRVKQTLDQLDSLRENARKKNDDLDRQERDAGIKYVQQLGQARAAYEKQVQRDRDDRRLQDSRKQEDRDRDDARQQRDFQRSLDQQDQDRATQLARRKRDERLQDQQAEQDHADKLADIQKKLGDDLERINRETREKLQEARGNFDVDQRRAQEDFDEERRKLLAEGKIREAQALTEKFAKDSRRRREDLERDQSRTVDAGDEQKRDAITQTNQALADEEKQFRQQQQRLQQQRAIAAADEAEDFARQRQRAIAAHAQQLADQVADRKRADDREAQDRRLADTRRDQDYAEQKAALKRAHDEQVAQIAAQRLADSAALAADRKKALDDLQKYLDDTKKKLEQAKQDQVEIARLTKEGMSAEAAKAVVDLQNAQNDFNRILDQNKRIFAAGGTTDALLYLQGFATTLQEQIRQAQLGAPIPPPTQRPGENPPFTPQPAQPPGRPDPFGGIHSHALTDREIDAIRAQALAPQRGGGGGGAQTIHVTVPIAAPTIDGQKVGSIAAQHVTQQISDELTVELDVHEASNLIGLQQAHTTSVV